jgi:hypothetical protein
MLKLISEFSGAMMKAIGFRDPVNSISDSVGETQFLDQMNEDYLLIKRLLFIVSLCTNNIGICMELTRANIICA